MSRGWLIGGGALLGMLLIASIIVAALEKAETLPAGTAQVTVQRFLIAVEEENVEIAHSLLSSDLRLECPVEEFFGREPYPDKRLTDDRITLVGTQTVKDTVFVTVRVTQFRGGSPFGASESSHQQRFTLHKEQGEWRFSDYPWPFFRCRKPDPERVAPAPTATQPPAPTPTPEEGQ